MKDHFFANNVAFSSPYRCSMTTPSDAVPACSQCFYSSIFSESNILCFNDTYRGSPHNAVLLQRGVPYNTAVLVRVRGGMRTTYLINSSTTAYFEQAQKSALQEDPL